MRQKLNELSGGLWRASCVLVVGVLPLSYIVHAQAASVPVFPYYASDLVPQSVYLWQQKPTAMRLLKDLNTLNLSLTEYCDAPVAKPISIEFAQKAYAKAAMSWAALSTVVVGPMLEKNTARLLDFRPTRPKLIERAIAMQSKNAIDMAKVGAPAKGFPALEWLLLDKKIQANTPACAYAREATQDISREISKLEWPAGQDTALSDQEDASPAANPFPMYFNQLIGGVHNLAWDALEKPALRLKDGQVAQWFEQPSDQANAYFQAVWATLRQLLLVPNELMSTGKAPEPESQVIPLEAFLYGLGKIDMAESLREQVLLADNLMSQVDTHRPETALKAAEQMKGLKAFLTGPVAAEMKVAVQFTSADGD